MQCGTHKRIQCWSNPDSKIRINPHHTQSLKFPFGSCHDRIFPEYKIRIIFSGLHQKLLAGSLHHKQNVFQTFLHVFDCINAFPTLFFYHPSPINNLHFLKNSHTLFSSSLIPSTTMCFHRWPVIERGLFGNPSGVSLGVRLVCLGVSLTIMVSCSLEAWCCCIKSKYLCYRLNRDWCDILSRSTIDIVLS